MSNKRVGLLEVKVGTEFFQNKELGEKNDVLQAFGKKYDVFPDPDDPSILVAVIDTIVKQSNEEQFIGSHRAYTLRFRADYPGFKKGA